MNTMSQIYLQKYPGLIIKMLNLSIIIIIIIIININHFNDYFEIRKYDK